MKYWIIELAPGAKAKELDEVNSKHEADEAVRLHRQLRGGNIEITVVCEADLKPCTCDDDQFSNASCECALHGKDNEAECHAQMKAECDAENAWLIHSENQFDPDAEEELRREQLDVGLMYLREQREKWEDACTAKGIEAVTDPPEPDEDGGFWYLDRKLQEEGARQQEWPDDYPYRDSVSDVDRSSSCVHPT